jgi:multiple antibiotic resistance protein
MNITKADIDAVVTVSFTLFAVIDILGSIPLLLALKKKMGGFQELKATLISGVLMVLFLYASGTLTTIMSLKANYDQTIILLAILTNLVIIYIVLRSLDRLEKILGPAGMIAIRKFFGVILLAIAVKIFSSNLHGLLK